MISNSNLGIKSAGCAQLASAELRGEELLSLYGDGLTARNVLTPHRVMVADAGSREFADGTWWEVRDVITVLGTLGKYSSSTMLCPDCVRRINADGS